jgi:type I site-specific restriction-modification system R (restriction) subunit
MNLFETYQTKLKLKQTDGRKFIFDPIRKKFFVFAPEELVRQLVILYLIEEKKYPKNGISVEKQIEVNGRQLRFDILVWNKNAEPLVLVECKAPDVKINQATFDQIAQYNLALKVRYLIVTNGTQLFCCEMDYDTKDYTFVEAIPDFETL